MAVQWGGAAVQGKSQVIVSWQTSQVFSLGPEAQRPRESSRGEKNSDSGPLCVGREGRDDL